MTLAELLASFSLATDLGLGQPMEHVLRSWRIAAALAERLGWAEQDRETLFYLTMLGWVGCVADAPEVATTFGDDIAFRADTFRVDLAGTARLSFFLRHAGSDGSAVHRLRSAGALVVTGGRRVIEGIQSHCLTTATLADRLGLAAEVTAGLRQFFTRWDGQGVPTGIGGAAISPAAQLVQLADVVEVHHRTGGLPAALAVARRRSGSHFSPALVEAFCELAPQILLEQDDEIPFAGDPLLGKRLSAVDLDTALQVLADFTDLRSPHRAGHSRAVGDLAAAAAHGLRLPEADQKAVQRAGWLHDIGLHGVPATILDKPATPSTAEWERIRLASYYTERVLARPAALAALGSLAACTHERMDGSGYHRGLSGAAIPLGGRILAAACALRAMTEPRAHRPALPATEAVTQLRREVHAGRLDADAVDAVIAAAGHGRRKRVSGPAGLTAREIEVLVLLARGTSTAAIAGRLQLSVKTVGTYIERIYARTGAANRATATLFALRHGLLDPLDL